MARPRSTSTEVAVVPDTALILPDTGQVLDLANPDDCAQALDHVVTMIDQLQLVRRQVTDALVDHAAGSGLKTKMRLPYGEVTLSYPNETHWDVEVLAELLDAGLPAARYAELVTETVETKVSAVVARQVADANPAYKAIIDRAKAVYPKRPSASVKARPS